jgi:CRP/FNR family transcriptional regulator, cyclic AMP receptor protein
MNAEIETKLLQFFSFFDKEKVKTNRVILQSHQNPGTIFCLTKGSVRMYATSKKGVDLTLNIFRPISLFPLGSVINDQKNTYSYQTLSNSTFYCAPKDKVYSFFKNEPSVTFDLLSRIYQGLEGYFLIMESLLGGTAAQRVGIQLLIQMERFGKIKLPHSKLASLTGLSRETVTREISKLKKAGLVEDTDSGGLIVTNHKKLRPEITVI